MSGNDKELEDIKQVLATGCVPDQIGALGGLCKPDGTCQGKLVCTRETSEYRGSSYSVHACLLPTQAAVGQ
jgi:hypothetical protein